MPGVRLPKFRCHSPCCVPFATVGVSRGIHRARGKPEPVETYAPGEDHESCQTGRCCHRPAEVLRYSRRLQHPRGDRHAVRKCFAGCAFQQFLELDGPEVAPPLMRQIRSFWIRRFGYPKIDKVRQHRRNTVDPFDTGPQLVYVAALRPEKPS